MIAGSQYDASGTLKKWWGNETLKQFEKKTSCMAQQYSRYEVNDMKVSGNDQLIAYT